MESVKQLLFHLCSHCPCRRQEGLCAQVSPSLFHWTRGAQESQEHGSMPQSSHATVVYGWGPMVSSEQKGQGKEMFLAEWEVSHTFSDALCSLITTYKLCACTLTGEKQSGWDPKSMLKPVMCVLYCWAVQEPNQFSLCHLPIQYMTQASACAFRKLFASSTKKPMTVTSEIHFKRGWQRSN